MKMQDYLCEYFEIEIHVPSDAFDKAAFLEDIKDVSDVESKAHAWAYGSINQPEKQHAHVYIDLRREDQVRIRIVFHNFGISAQDTRPPYMEDCGQWLGKFVKDEELPAELEVLYRFDKGYAPVMGLPFPLLTPRKDLSGSQVVGISIQPPRTMKIRQAIIQKDKDDFTIYITTKVQMNLRSFDLEGELKRLTDPIMTFVYKIGEAQ
jgi:hypothetical protein